MRLSPDILPDLAVKTLHRARMVIIIREVCSLTCRTLPPAYHAGDGNTNGPNTKRMRTRDIPLDLDRPLGTRLLRPTIPSTAKRPFIYCAACVLVDCSTQVESRRLPFYLSKLATYTVHSFSSPVYWPTRTSFYPVSNSANCKLV
jgi:hypothetical protein